MGKIIGSIDNRYTTQDDYDRWKNDQVGRDVMTKEYGTGFWHGFWVGAAVATLIALIATAFA